MQCEICEKGIEKGKRIKLEGSIVVACEQCSRYGEIVAEAQPPKPKPRVVEKRAEVGERPNVEERPEFILYIQEELVEGYPVAQIGHVSDSPRLVIRGSEGDNIIELTVPALKAAWQQPFGDLI